MCFRASALCCAAREEAKAAVLDFCLRDYGHQSYGAAMLRMQQDIRRRRRAALVLLRAAATGALRPEACRGHAHIGEFIEAGSNTVALPRGPAARRASNAGRRHDAAGARGAARRVHGTAAALR